MRIRSVLSTVVVAVVIATTWVPATAEQPTDARITEVAPGGDTSSADGLQAAPQPEFSYEPDAKTVTITFDEYPLGTAISTQYEDQGVYFAGDSPYIWTDNAQPTSPVLTGTPKYYGAIEGLFLSPVSFLAFDAGYFDQVASARVTVYGEGGELLASGANSATGIRRFFIDRSGRTPIKSFRIELVDTEAAGYSIDNVTFSRPMTYVALGDSYASGEGAGYTGGQRLDNTVYGDTAGRANGCHRTATAYPERLASYSDGYGLDLSFVACSGAVTDNILENPQWPNSPIELPGWQTQINDLRTMEAVKGVDFVTIGIGGNDIGFAEVIRTCVLELSLNCMTSEYGEELRNTVNAVYFRLVETYTEVRNAAPNAEIYAFGYPQILHESRWCGALSGLLRGEREDLRDLTTQLNGMVERAAAAAGIHYVELEDVFEPESTICGNDQKVHGIVLVRSLGGLWARSAQESFHPTSEGQKLIAERFKELFPLGPGNYPNPRPQVVTPPTIDGRTVTFGSMTLSGNDPVITYGQFVTMKLDNLQPGSTVTVATYSTETVDGTYVVGPDGSVEIPYQPSVGLETGVHTIAVEGTAADGSVYVASASYVLLPKGGTFIDDDGSAFGAAIEALVYAEITKGCNPPLNNEYCPDNSVTRGQMAAFLTRSLGLAAASGDTFVDDDGSVFEANIGSLAAAGITLGCNPPVNDQYCPDMPVTRGQMAAFLTRAFDLPSVAGDPFVDDDGSVFEANIGSLAAAGITLGCNPPVNDQYCPDMPVTRGQMAAFLVRALGLTPLPPP